MTTDTGGFRVSWLVGTEGISRLVVREFRGKVLNWWTGRLRRGGSKVEDHCKGEGRGHYGLKVGVSRNQNPYRTRSPKNLCDNTSVPPLGNVVRNMFITLFKCVYIGVK